MDIHRNIEETLLSGKNLLLPTYRDMKPILYVLALFCWLTSYGQKGKPLDLAVQIVINPSVTYQTIEHFGASDAWSCPVSYTHLDVYKRQVY